MLGNQCNAPPAALLSPPAYRFIRDKRFLREQWLVEQATWPRKSGIIRACTLQIKRPASNACLQTSETKKGMVRRHYKRGSGPLRRACRTHIHKSMGAAFILTRCDCFPDHLALAAIAAHHAPRDSFPGFRNVKTISKRRSSMPARNAEGYCVFSTCCSAPSPRHSPAGGVCCNTSNALAASTPVEGCPWLRE